MIYHLYSILTRQWEVFQIIPVSRKEARRIVSVLAEMILEKQLSILISSMGTQEILALVGMISKRYLVQPLQAFQ